MFERAGGSVAPQELERAGTYRTTIGRESAPDPRELAIAIKTPGEPSRPCLGPKAHNAPLLLISCHNIISWFRHQPSPVPILLRDQNTRPWTICSTHLLGQYSGLAEVYLPPWHLPATCKISIS